MFIFKKAIHNLIPSLGTYVCRSELHIVLFFVILSDLYVRFLSMIQKEKEKICKKTQKHDFTVFIRQQHQRQTPL